MILGYLGALLVGLTLGLLGGGGSILTVPILVYIMGISPTLSTAYSLFIVGTTAGIGGIRNHLLGQLDVKVGLIFAAPALAAVYWTRRFLMPSLPDVLLSTAGFTLTKDMFIMILFAILMIGASYSMIRGRKEVERQISKSPNFLLIVIEGIVVGILTGMVGAGGGFLIIPALVLLVGLPMKRAVATSLMIISIKSLIGFLGDLSNLAIDWGFLLSFTATAVAGIFVGIHLSQFIDGKSLKKGFGWFVLIMGIYIFIREAFFNG